MLRDINDIAGKATGIGSMIITLAISFSVIWIIISVVRYLVAGGEEDRKKGGMAILYGVIGLFVILSIWGLVAILRTSFRTDDSTPQPAIDRVSNLPRPPGVRSGSSNSTSDNPYIYKDTYGNSINLKEPI